jgi:multiple sugar transport system substrate-binding protein
VLLSLLAGCPQDDPAKQVHDLPFVGQEIRIAVPDEFGFRGAWEGPLNEWAEQSGARYGLSEYSPAAGPGSVGAGPFAGSSDRAQPTLAIFPLDRAGEIIAAGQLAPIPPALLDAEENGLAWQDLFGGVREKLASRKNQPLFIPLSVPVLVCYFRQDLLNAAGLAPPQTWDDYQQLLDNLAGWAPECTAVEPWSEEFRATIFLARAVSLAQHPGQYSLFFDIDTGEPLINSAGFVRALETARSALAKMPADVRRFNPADCRNELLQGRAALGIAFETPPIGSPSETAASAERPQGLEIGFIRLPGSHEIYDNDRRMWQPVANKKFNHVTLAAFSGWGVGAAAGNSPVQTEAGWNALLKICGDRLTAGFPPGIVDICRESQMHTAGIAASQLESREAVSYANAVAHSLRETRLVADLPVIGRTQFHRALASGLAVAIDGSMSPEQALESVARDWREIAEKLGRAKVRDSYRSSLGLSPKPK